MSGYGIRSPVLSPEPTRSKFDTDAIKNYMNKLLSTTLAGKTFPPTRDRDKLNEWSKEIGTRVREQMVEQHPKGFKYIVLTQIDENLGQGRHAKLVCHWDDEDAVASAMFANETLLCSCTVFAVRQV